jgi:hypothetical protein
MAVRIGAKYVQTPVRVFNSVDTETTALCPDDTPDGTWAITLESPTHLVSSEAEPPNLTAMEYRFVPIFFPAMVTRDEPVVGNLTASRLVIVGASYEKKSVDEPKSVPAVT